MIHGCQKIQVVNELTSQKTSRRDAAERDFRRLSFFETTVKGDRQEGREALGSGLVFVRS